MDKYDWRFEWKKIKSEAEEKKLRTYDAMALLGGALRPSRFFIHDWLLECWHDLIGKDIEVTPVEAYTTSGPVKEFHFIFIKHAVKGWDKELSDLDRTDPKWVPKGDNGFMEGHQIAVEGKPDFIYITPELRAKTLAKKRKLKGVSISTFKERWERMY